MCYIDSRHYNCQDDWNAVSNGPWHLLYPDYDLHLFPWDLVIVYICMPFETDVL